MSKQRFTGESDEAVWFARLVNAWSAAQTIVEQLAPVLQSVGLIKEDGSLDTDRVLALHAKATGEELEKPT